jgi:hypothetical protein
MSVELVPDFDFAGAVVVTDALEVGSCGWPYGQLDFNFLNPPALLNAKRRSSSLAQVLAGESPGSVDEEKAL